MISSVCIISGRQEMKQDQVSMQFVLIWMNLFALYYHCVCRSVSYLSAAAVVCCIQGQYKVEVVRVFSKVPCKTPINTKAETKIKKEC